MALNEKLCDLDNQGFVVNHLKDYRKLVRHAEHVCISCGRVARHKKNLCDPERLYPKEKAGQSPVQSVTLVLAMSNSSAEFRSIWRFAGQKYNAASLVDQVHPGRSVNLSDRFVGFHSYKLFPPGRSYRELNSSQ